MIAVGVGLRLAFISVYPTLPFWDSRALVHFASLIRQHGLAAEGWYWAQLNSGLPMILAALFRFAPGDPIPVARAATAVATGLVAVIPFVLWRPVLAFRWRLLAGALLALWPGQIFFSGVVAQDNWVLLPVIGLASLAARRLLEQGRGHPVAGGLLYAAAIGIRQEMMIVLLPVVLAASIDWNEARRFRRDLSRLGIIVFLSLLALGTQRFLATGRASLTTEHGALGLFGSFMPGASDPGWIDARAYATAVDPQAPRALFGNQRTLLRMTWEEVKRRPGFHFVRIAAWLPRLALNSDADNLLWSVGAPQSQADGRQADAQAFQRRWAPRLRWELGIVQGLFVMTVLIGLQRRNAAILVLSSAVLLKFMVHMVVSPLGRLLVPAVALELLTIPLGVRALASGSLRIRLAAIAGTAATCLLLVLGVPSLADFVVRHDSPVLQGIRQFNLRVDDEGVVQCELGQGVLTGIGPHWATLRTAREEPVPGDVAQAVCATPALEPGETLVLNAQDPYTPGGMGAPRTERILVDGREVFRRQMTGDGAQAERNIGSKDPVGQPASVVSIEILASSGQAVGTRGRDASLRFEFARTASAGVPLTRSQ